MRVTRPGAKNNRIRLVWSKYYKYVVHGQEYCFKQNAYATYCDGWIDSERIVLQTYRNAIRRGKECIEIILHENMEGAAAEHLIMIFSEKLNVPRDQIQEHIINIMKALKEIKKQTALASYQEYNFFIMMLEYHLHPKENQRN